KSDEGRLKVFAAMRNYMLYFQSFTFKLLRYDDYDEFSSFFERALTFAPETTQGARLARLMDKLKQFRIFVDTCIRQLSNRAELQDRPIDTDRIEVCIKQYLQ
ncbi:MAG TPA: hypothetical protein VFG09_07155, partial [Thermodesulfovibrionales bacterium]|nr:hypothetical protein [Thermodesulfovibrionales bacterium]